MPTLNAYTYPSDTFDVSVIGLLREAKDADIEQEVNEVSSGAAVRMCAG